MKNHSEKVRDMRRAALPSTRCVALDRRLIHRRERQAVHLVLRELEPDKELAGDVVAPTLRTRSDLGWMVEERRARDHLAPVERWAARRVQLRPSMQYQDLCGQLAYFRHLLGGTTVGLHALLHIAWELERLERRATMAA